MAELPPSTPDDDLLSIVAHELRNPLSSIVGFASLLEHPRFGEIAPRKLEFAGRIRRAADLMTMMLASVCLAASLENQQVRLLPTRLDLLEVLTPLAETFGALSSEKQVAFELLCEQGLTAWGDRALLTQVLHNLLSNALRNTDAGRIEVRAVGRGAEVELAVIDTGRGIPPAEQPRLGTKFCRLPDHHHGIGLGLYVAQNILALHSSRLDVESPLRGDGGASSRAPQGGQGESPRRGDGGASPRAGTRCSFRLAVDG